MSDSKEQEELGKEELNVENIRETSEEETSTEEIEEEVVEEVVEEKTPEQELAELNDKYLRLYSDFDNFRRRTAKERLELMGTASSDVMSSLLPVMDDFDRAFKALEDKTGDMDNFKEGIILIHEKFRKALLEKV